jgi:hypothetical protein
MKIFDFCVEAACWFGIAIVILVTLDVIRAEIVYDKAVSNIPPIVYNHKE